MTIETPPLPAANHFSYDGKTCTIYKIVIGNFFLCLITLWIYRPWAKTRIRRYIYSRFTFMGERFQYTGTGGELFVGSCQVFGSLFAAFFVLEILRIGLIIWAQGGLQEETPQAIAIGLVFTIITYSAFLYLTFFGQFAGKRYRFSRTKWRGIRGAITGKANDYALYGIRLFLLNLVTLWLIAPRNHLKLRKKLVDNMHFGQQRCTFNPDPRSLYRVHYITWALAIPTLGLSRFWYRAALRNQYYRAMRAGSIHFHGDQTGLRLLWLVIGNFLLILTLIGLPYAIQRIARYFARHIHILGDLSDINLLQVTDEGRATGDVIADAYDGVDFDMGLF